MAIELELEECRATNRRLLEENADLRKEIDFLRFRLKRVADYARWSTDIVFNPSRWEPDKFSSDKYPDNIRR